MRTAKKQYARRRGTHFRLAGGTAVGLVSLDFAAAAAAADDDIAFLLFAFLSPSRLGYLNFSCSSARALRAHRGLLFVPSSS